MRTLKALVLMIALVAAAAAPQTENLGLNSFANTGGPILLALDASLAVKQLDQPYLMFVLYMGANKKGQDIRVSRNDVVMVYNGQEYPMPSVKDFRAVYSGQIKDLDMYSHLGKEGIASSWVRVYQFPDRLDFFPPNTLGAPLVADAASLYNLVGFQTLLYFKNPGFKRGDTFKLKVRDLKDPAIAGEVDVIL
jgi:hypothetical protein